MSVYEDRVPVVDEDLLRRAGLGAPGGVEIAPRRTTPALAPVTRGCRAVVEALSKGFGFP